MKSLTLLFFGALVGSVSGFAANNNANGKSLKQIEDQMKSMRAELKKTKMMINKNGSQVVVSNTSTDQEMLKALRSSNNRLANLEKNVVALKNGVGSLQGEIVSLKKSQMLATAIQNAKFNSFSYYSYRASDNWYNSEPDESSETIVRQMLFAFQKGHASTVAMGSRKQFNHVKGKEKEKAVGEYYDALREQIHELTGIKPNMHKLDDGRCKFSFPRVLK